MMTDKEMLAVAANQSAEDIGCKADDFFMDKNIAVPFKLGVGAYDEGRLIGLAGCSADAKDMLQIGVDVLPEYRRVGVASALTSRLATEILKRDKVPFYCCAWSNIRSAKNAIRSGFSLAWAEMTVNPLEAVNEMNEKKKNAV